MAPLQQYSQRGIYWSCKRPFKKAHKDSEPSTLDSQSSTTLFLSSEEPGPSTAALPSPSSSCEPQAFSPGASGLPALLPPPPAPAAPPAPPAAPGPGPGPGRAGPYSAAGSSPEAAPRLADWLPCGPATTPPCGGGGGGGGGDERRERPAAPGPGPEGGRTLRPGAAGREEGAEAPGASPPPAARASLEASVGDILLELRTMNGHLGVIARALTRLASTLGPPPQPLPEARDAD